MDRRSVELWTEDEVYDVILLGLILLPTHFPYKYAAN